MGNEQTSILERINNVFQEQSDKKLSRFFLKARKHIVLFCIVLSIGLFALYSGINLIASSSNQSKASEKVGLSSPRTQPISRHASEIYVDLSGAVVKPDTYKVKEGTRLFELVSLAGGLSAEADKAFIQRNFNFAIILTDEQKVHLPSVYEVRDGIYTERNKLVSLDYASPLTRNASQQSTRDSQEKNDAISLNTGSLEQLKILPGVGDVTAQRIIAGRPYTTVEDILNKGIIKQSLYDKIVNQIEP